MNHRLPHADQNGPAALAQTLHTTLRQEEEALARLCAAADEQLEALRTREPERLEEATGRANEAMNALADLRKTRERQMHLLGRLLRLPGEDAPLAALADVLAHHGHANAARDLRAARDRVHALAGETRRRCETLDVTLQFAVGLGRELIQTIQGVEAAPKTAVYTASGSTAQTARPRSILNRVG